MTAITVENFQQIILEESKNKMILVDFWAEQVPESVELRDKLTVALQGFEDHMMMTTVDCQSQQQIAMQFGIQGLPTAVIVKDGQPLDALSGPQTDEDIKAFLAKHLPKPEDGLLEQAKASLAQGDANQAYTFATQAHQFDSERADIKLVLIDAYLQTGKVAEAQALLETIRMVDQDSDYQAMVSKLELAQQAADSPEIQALEQQLKADGENVEITRKLAVQYSQVSRFEEALALLFTLVRKDGSDQQSKDMLLDVLKSLPDGDPLAGKYRRKLYTLMY